MHTDTLMITRHINYTTNATLALGCHGIVYTISVRLTPIMLSAL